MNTLNWTAAFDSKSNLQTLKNLSAALAPRCSEVGKQIARLAESESWNQLLSIKLDPRSVRTEELSEYIADAQVRALFSKNPSLETGIDREDNAWQEFDRCERKCKETNEFFRALSRHPTFAVRGDDATKHNFDVLPSFFLALLRAKKTIARVVGTRPPNIADLGLKFGPGATTGIKKKHASWQQKLAQMPSCSDELYHSRFFDDLLRSLPHWLRSHGEEEFVLDDEGYISQYFVLPVAIRQSMLQFVAKNAEIDRAIIVQPTLNSMLQAGIEGWMKKALRKVGIDLSDQFRNQQLARFGSLTGERATLDLKSASDLKARELVKFLFSEEWFELLSAASCRAVRYEDRILTMEKMSSMGSGITFPLETLIFWALARAVAKHPSDVCAYGDDIICNTEDAEAVMTVLTQAGFDVNFSKSYVDGPFRESCGADYYKGIDTRPTFVKNILSFSTLFTIHNSFYRRGDFEIADLIRTWIPPGIALYGPDGYGDGHLLTENPPYRRNRMMRRSGWSGFLFDTYREVGTNHPNLYPGDWVTPLYSIYRAEGIPDEDEQYFTRDLEVHRGRMFRQFGYAPASRCARLTNLSFLPSGRALWSTPGTNGYEKMSIYTLAG